MTLEEGDAGGTLSVHVDTRARRLFGHVILGGETHTAEVADVAVLVVCSGHKENKQGLRPATSVLLVIHRRKGGGGQDTRRGPRRDGRPRIVRGITGEQRRRGTRRAEEKLAEGEGLKGNACGDLCRIIGGR